MITLHPHPITPKEVYTTLCHLARIKRATGYLATIYTLDQKCLDYQNKYNIDRDYLYITYARPIITRYFNEQ